VLPRFQIQAGRDLDFKVCYPRERFDRQSISWDLNYFKYYFLRLAGIPFSEQALEDDFDRLTDFLLSADRDYFLYRDFQSRNIMLRGSQPYFLDYQGDEKALCTTTLRLFYDGKAICLPNCDSSCWIITRHAGGFIKSSRTFMRHYYAYVYVRICRLGCLRFSRLLERKPHFLQSVPYALKNLRWLLHHGATHRDTHADQAFKSMLSSETTELWLKRKTLSYGYSVFHFTRVFRRTREMEEDSFSMRGASRIRDVKNDSRSSRERTLQ
jgi:hypothetical protein